MEPLPTPVQTPLAWKWLQRRDAGVSQTQQALLAAIDGRRNIIELESVARALRLAPAALERLREQGLIELAGSS